MKRIYFDHAAATPLDERAEKLMQSYGRTHYANPSAIHSEAVFVRKAVDDARHTFSSLMGVHADEIIFTASATESINLAILGTVHAWQKSHPDMVAHIIVSAIEHDAVLQPARILEKQGVRLTIVPVDKEGIIDLAILRDALTPETVLVSVAYANNEIGTIQPIKEIAKIIRKWKKEHRGVNRTLQIKGEDYYPLFHTDACQAVNYLDLHIPALGVNLLTINASKIYGPKGSGLLYVERNIPIEAMITGGSHEGGRRGGTENVSGIMGFAEAFKITLDMVKEESERLTIIRNYCMQKLQAEIPNLAINGSQNVRLSNNVNFSIPNLDHEFLVIALDSRGIACSTKSACNEEDAETSHVLAALRLASHSDLPASGIRLSFGRQTTKDEVDVFISVLKDILLTFKNLPFSSSGK